MEENNDKLREEIMKAIDGGGYGEQEEFQEEEQEVRSEHNEEEPEGEGSQQFDLSEFGEYDNVSKLKDDFLSYKQRFEDTEKIKGEFSLKEKEYQEQLSKLEEQSKVLIEDEDLLRLNIAKNSNNPNFQLYAKLVVDGKESLDNKTAIRMKYLKEMPELKDDLETLDEFINDQYNISTPPEEYDADDPEYKAWERKQKINQLKLKKDALEFKESIEKEFKSIEIPKRQKSLTEDEMILQKANSRREWSPYTDDIIRTVSNFATKFKVGENEHEFKFGATPELEKKYRETLDKIVYENAIPLDKDNVVKIASELRTNFIIENLDKIINGAIEQALNAYNDDFNKEINPSERKVNKVYKGGDLRSSVLKAVGDIL